MRTARETASACSAWRKVTRLPHRARAAGLALLGTAAAPAAVSIVAAVGDSSFARFLAAHPGFANLLASCAAVATVLAFEPPRSASPIVYAGQLRARFLELQSTLDADDRRRFEEAKGEGR